MVELVQPVFILKNARENSLVKTKEEKCSKAACRDCETKWPSRSIPVSRLRVGDDAEAAHSGDDGASATR